MSMQFFLNIYINLAANNRTSSFMQFEVYTPNALEGPRILFLVTYWYFLVKNK